VGNHIEKKNYVNYAVKKTGFEILTYDRRSEQIHKILKLEKILLIKKLLK